MNETGRHSPDGQSPGAAVQCLVGRPATAPGARSLSARRLRQTAPHRDGLYRGKRAGGRRSTETVTAGSMSPTSSGSSTTVERRLESPFLLRTVAGPHSPVPPAGRSSSTPPPLPRPAFRAAASSTTGSANAEGRAGLPHIQGPRVFTTSDPVSPPRSRPPRCRSRPSPGSRPRAGRPGRPEGGASRAGRTRASPGPGPRRRPGGPGGGWSP